MKSGQARRGARQVPVRPDWQPFMESGCGPQLPLPEAGATKCPVGINFLEKAVESLGKI